MKSLIRWSASLGLAGSIFFSSLFVSGPALALTEQQVVERLRTVPVFALTDANGSPLVATPSAGEQGSPVATIFISQNDAKNFLEGLKRDNPELAEGVQIAAVSLADAYQLAQRGRDESNPLEVAFIPAQQQVEAARSLLQEQNATNADQFRGVPLFIARAAGEDGAYLTIRQNEQEVIPMFFTREQLQSVLDRLGEVQPELANSMGIQVVNLEGLIETLHTSNNEELNRIILVPPTDSVEFIRSLQQRANQGGQGQGQGQGPQRPRNQQNPQNRPNQQNQRPQ